MSTKRGFAILRIVFGIVWLIDAYFKWQPKFSTDFISYVSGGLDGQPAWVQGWIHFWLQIIGVNPHFFALIIAILETLLALGLIFGFLTRYAIFGGIILSLAIWSTAESFGGPYKAGSTDIGSAIIYVLVFVALLLGRSWETFSLDGKIQKSFRRNTEKEIGRAHV